MLSAKLSLLPCLFACFSTFSCSSPDEATINPGQSHVEGADTRSATEIIEAMVADCAACAEARAARHNERPLYQRLGGNEKITEFVAKLIELHMQNELVGPYFAGVDLEGLATHLVNFIGAGTGGEETYEGRSMVDSHAGMAITPEVFLSAGGDIGAAMQAVGWGADEQEEFMCIILSMKDDVL